MYLLCMAALLFGLWMRITPEGRRWGFFLVCLYMGVVGGVCTAMTGPYQLFPSQDDGFMSPAIGFIPLALYWCIGIALFLGLGRQSDNRPKDRRNVNGSM